MNKKILILNAFLSTVVWAQAPAGELGTRDLLIQKLEKVQLTLAMTDPSKVAVTLRLADLLSERARESSMKELESGCTACVAGEKDRLRALGLYKEVLSKVPFENLGRVLIQIGHLNELNGNQKEAITYYEKTLKEIPNQQIKSEAHLSLAEVYFKQNKYPLALDHYLNVVNEKTASSRGLSSYRASWCYFNMGQIPKAVNELKSILKNPELQSRSGVAEAQADQQFLEEVSRDLFSFVAKGIFQKTELKELAMLSPVTTRNQNIISLALEMERLGKRNESAEVWNYALETVDKPELRLEILVHLAPLQYEPKNSDQSLATLQSAVALWTDLKGCGKKECADTQKLIRAFIVNWNQTEKKSPSDNLLKAYSMYIDLFQNDFEVLSWAAVAAKVKKDYVLAGQFLEKEANQSILQKNSDKLENALLAFLEVSELSQQKDLIEKASDLYLSMSEKKSKLFEVQYQKAKRAYDSGDIQKSFIHLNELASNDKVPLSLRIQSAHLSLDALVLAKDENRLAEWSDKYSTMFTGPEAKEFAVIKQKTILSQSAKIASENSEQAFLILEKFNSQLASAEDKKTFLKNKILLAEKTHRFAVASSAVDDYLALPSLNMEEKDFALGRKAWLAEIRLDFGTAFKSLEMMPQKSLSADQKALKLAIYSELAGQVSNPYYQQFLLLSKDEAAKRSVAAELVRKSKDPEKELEKNITVISKDSELLARLYAEIISKPGRQAYLAKANSDSRISKTIWGQTLTRYALLKELISFSNELAGMKVDSGQQKQMTKTIKLRGQKLEKLEALTAKAIRAGDWSSQIVAFTILAEESNRFYQELMSLPMPAGLSAEDENKYMQLLSQQAAPYKNRSDEATAKLKEFWALAGWKEALEKSMLEASEFKIFIDSEISALEKVTQTENYKDQHSFISGLKSKSEVAAQKKIEIALLEEARNQVRLNPLNREKIEGLKNLENEAKNFAMVHYLEGRLKSLDDSQVTSEKTSKNSSEKSEEKK